MRPIYFLYSVLILGGCALSGGPGLPALSEERFDLVRYGMTRDDALRLIGRPDETMKFPLSGTEAWDYLSQDAWGYLTSFSVTFGPDGRVVSRFARRINDGGDHGK